MSTRAEGRLLVAVLLLCLLGGCAGMENRSSAASRSSGESTDREIHLDLIRRMLDQQQYFAALAHIQQQQLKVGNSIELRYLEAEARRELKQFAEADALYRGLLGTSLAAKAYHGLGLLYAPRDLPFAIANIREATRREPTNASARNDLGYALMRARRFRDAMPELATAVELDPASSKARNNLLLLLIITGDEARVQRIVREAAVPADVVARLRRDAQGFKTRPAGTGVKR